MMWGRGWWGIGCGVWGRWEGSLVRLVEGEGVEGVRGSHMHSCCYTVHASVTQQGGPVTSDVHGGRAESAHTVSTGIANGEQDPSPKAKHSDITVYGVGQVWTQTATGGSWAGIPTVAWVQQRAEGACSCGFSASVPDTGSSGPSLAFQSCLCKQEGVACRTGGCLQRRGPLGLHLGELWTRSPPHPGHLS